MKSPNQIIIEGIENEDIVAIQEGVMQEDFEPLDWILDMWNDLVMEVYNYWKEEQILKDSNLPDDDDESGEDDDDESGEYEDYIEENYGYEVFCEISEENKTLQYITCLGCPSNFMQLYS